MHWKNIFSIIGQLTLFLAITMIIPIIFAIYYKDNNLLSFIKSIILILVLSIFIRLCFKSNNNSTIINQREGLIIVSIGWIIVSLLGALPFYFSSQNFTFVDAFFESVSGFTTTGASILTNIETQPKSLLLWRSFIQWLGGMGIIVLSITILPLMKASGNKLYKAEVPSPVPDKLKPKIRDTAIILWKVYLLFSIIELLLLIAGNLSFFDALCHTFTTMPTGGFSTLNLSINHYHSLYIDLIILIFMIIGGINFSLHYQMLKGKSVMFWKDSECKFFLITCMFFSTLIALNLYKKVYPSIIEAFRYSTFQVVSIITTTGYITADYELWPSMSKLIIALCMFIGASAGSTSGGMKCLRIVLCLKYCYKELFSIVHPRAVTQIKINGQSVSNKIIRSIFGFLSLYIIIFVFFSIILAGMGLNVTTSLGSVAASLGNIGPGFGAVGPSKNYALIPNLGKYILTFCMLLGRLEIYTLIVLIVPEFWRK